MANHDRSNGWEAIANDFIGGRSPIGVAALMKWSEALPPGGTVLDIGCGSGRPVAEALVMKGFQVFGIDASPTLVAAFERRFPGRPVRCETVETSTFFDRTFNAAIAIGLIFLLPTRTQRRLIHHVGKVIEPGGRFLFTAPEQACIWPDNLTGRRSHSLGLAEYRSLLMGAGMVLESTFVDEGANHYLSARRLR